MKKLITAGLVMFMMAGVSSSYGASESVIKLKVADVFPITHPVSVTGIKPWMEKVTALTNGKVQFDYFPAEQLGKAKDTLKLLQGKLAHVSFVGPSYVVSTMPLSGVMEIPGAVSSSVAGVNTFWKLTQTLLLKPDYLDNGIVPIFVYSLPPYEIYTTTKAVKTFADMKGLKLRTTGGANDQAIKDLGATPVSMPIQEMYEAIDKRVVDGTIMSAISVKPYKVQELVKYATQGANLGTYVGTYCVNLDVWKSLPANVQKAMVQAGEETSMELAKVLDKQAADFTAEFVAGGMQIYKLTPAEQTAWAQKMSSVEAEWLAKLKNRSALGVQLIQERNRLTKEFAEK